MRRSRARKLVAAAALALGSAAVAGSVTAKLTEASQSPAAEAVKPLHLASSQRVRPPGLLRASGGRARALAAVTFLVDGRPFATDTTKPYAVRIFPGELAPGAHRVQLETVHRNGSRGRTASAQVVVGPDRGSILHASPRKGLRKALRELAHGHVTVQLAPGRYSVRNARLGDGATLLGGKGVILAAPPEAGFGVLVASGHDIAVVDVTIDGSGSGTGTGTGDNHAIVVQTAKNVVLRRIDVRNTHTDSIYMWGRLADVTVQDSTLEGGGTADSGVTAMVRYGNDVSVVRTKIDGFRGWGINFAQRYHDVHDNGLRSLALDNVITRIRDTEDTRGRSQGGIWSGGPQATIVGNRISDIGWDGIETVGTSDDVVVASNQISGTRTGIYLEHATTNSRFRDNVIGNVQTGFAVEWRYDGVGSSGNSFSGNRIVATETGLFVDAEADSNTIERNVFVGGGRPAIVLQGSSDNRVHDNEACGSSGPLLEIRDASATAERNLALRNSTRLGCDGTVSSRRASARR